MNSQASFSTHTL